MSAKISDIYQAMKKAGVEIDNHCSDLYVPINEATTAIVNEYKYKCNVTKFVSQIDNEPWYDIPFAYAPYWKNKMR